MKFYTYVFPCVWEDYCKVGFSRDPFARLQAFHRRWFEFFDLDRIVLIVSDSEREARDMELELRRPLGLHRAPMPLTISTHAGGHTEWLRGSCSQLETYIGLLRQRNYQLDAHPRLWLRNALLERSDRLFSWCISAVGENPGATAGDVGIESQVMDALDAYAALEIDVSPFVPTGIMDWYKSRTHRDLLRG